MILSVMAISNLVLTRQIYSEETNGAHAHYREPVPLTRPFSIQHQRSRHLSSFYTQFLRILFFSFAHFSKHTNVQNSSKNCFIEGFSTICSSILEVTDKYSYPSVKNKGLFVYTAGILHVLYNRTGLDFSLHKVSLKREIFQLRG